MSKRHVPGSLIFAMGGLVVMGAAGMAIVAEDQIRASYERQAHATHTIVENAPDWTYAPCSDWAGISTPTLPPYTFTEACVATNGSIITPSK